MIINNNDNLKQEYKDLILKAITYHFPDVKIILFGSRARGTNRPGSDVDLALDTGKIIKLHELSRERLKLDLIQLNKALTTLGNAFIVATRTILSNIPLYYSTMLLA